MEGVTAMTRDMDKLVKMSNEEIGAFLREYKEWVLAGIKNETDGCLDEIRSSERNITALKRELEEIELSNYLSEIKNRHRARIGQNILIHEEDIKYIVSRVKKLDKHGREFTALKFLRPMLSGLLEKGFYRFGFSSMNGSIALAGWTDFVEIESARFNFAAQKSLPTVFLLGHYKIEMAWARRGSLPPVKIYNLDNLSSTTFPHPHVNESSDPCFGDFMEPIQKCFEEKRFLHVFHLIRLFLSSYSLNLPPGNPGYNRRPYARALIEYWPEKGSIESPKKPPAKEGTGSYDG